MTLVVGISTAEYAAQISDRRITAFDRNIRSDEFNKQILYHSGYCRFIVGFCGLAQLNTRNFDADSWLAETFSKQQDINLFPDRLVENLRIAASERFCQADIQAISPQSQRFTMMLSGFVSTNVGPLPAHCIISNFEDDQMAYDFPFNEFKASLYIGPNSPDSHAMRTIGYIDSDARRRLDGIKELVIAKRPPDAIVGKAIKVI